MRTWLYNRVKASLAGSIFENRVYSPGGADDRVAPFAVVTMMVEQAFLQMPPSAGANNVPFAVNLHVAAGESMLDIDDAGIAIRNGIVTEDSIVVGGITVMNLRWSDFGQDTYDDHWHTDYRPVRFNAVICR